MEKTLPVEKVEYYNWNKLSLLTHKTYKDSKILSEIEMRSNFVNMLHSLVRGSDQEKPLVSLIASTLKSSDIDQVNKYMKNKSKCLNY